MVVINKNMIKNFSNIKNKIYILMFIVFLSTRVVTVLAVQPQINSDIYGGQSVQSIDNLSDSEKGIIPCDPYSDDVTKRCTPKAGIDMIKKLAEVFIYLIVLALFITLIAAGLGYVFYGKSPSYLIKWKKYMTNSAISLLIIMGVFGLVLGVLAAAGFREDVLNFLKQILASDNISPFQHSFAQNVPIPESGSDGSYVNFFPRETIGSLTFKIIKVGINYIVAPVLVFATIWSGFLFVKAEGNPEKLQNAKKFAIRVATGIVVAAAASLIVGVVLNTLNDVSKEVNSKSIQDPPSTVNN